jgi:carboxypeptidase D
MSRLLASAVAGGALALAPVRPAVADTWTEYSEIGQTFALLEATYPDLCARYDLGLSYEGRHLWALRISDNVLLEEDEPEFKYIAAMHGNEIVGTKLSMMLVDYLLTNYGTDPQATNIVDEIELWIVPLMNPDGYDRTPRSRYNAQGIDLNRNFPAYGEPNTPDGRAVETQVIMNWSFGQSFTCSANLHTGTLVVNYPLDNDDPGSQYTEDEELFIYVSEQYSQYNPPMWNSPEFYHGVTNGADWYMIWGGMQDWNYHFMGNTEVTLELSDVHNLPASQIPVFWDDNRQSMLAYIETCLIGVRGLVTDATSGEPLPATITVVGRDHPVYADPDVGDYSRMLLPGRRQRGCRHAGGRDFARRPRPGRLAQRRGDPAGRPRDHDYVVRQPGPAFPRAVHGGLRPQRLDRRDRPDRAGGDVRAVDAVRARRKLCASRAVRVRRRVLRGVGRKRWHVHRHRRSALPGRS